MTSLKRDPEPRADDQRGSFARRSRKWIAGAVLGGFAVVISGYVVRANDWLAQKVHTDSAMTSVVYSNEFKAQNGWFFATSPANLPVPPLLGEKAFNDWVRSNGGIPASGYYVTVVLQGASEKTVVVDSLRVEVTRREPVPRGTSPDQRGCGGELDPALFEANLDTSPVKITPKAGEDNTGKPIAAKSLPRTVSNSDPDYWQIAAVTSKWEAEWIAFIDYTAGGKTGTIKIDNHGKPFRTAALARAVGVRAVYEIPYHWDILPEPRGPIC
jgi:hypothetical protein